MGAGAADHVVRSSGCRPPSGHTTAVVCHRCDVRGYIARTCQRKQWCHECQSSSHHFATGRRRPQRRHDVLRVSEGQFDREYTFAVRDYEAEVYQRHHVE